MFDVRRAGATDRVSLCLFVRDVGEGNGRFGLGVCLVSLSDETNILMIVYCSAVLLIAEC